ncbi:response regulator [Confluentibacter flavum]|uniref:Response regulator n=1 Tax=Confluentibacter flavum TaxID=1909700 RepID=A0A2N3HIG8_9FLAO|nr:response regulator [Confluentibacter flavum]PKQ44769.1 response regulator [Confluentibacter flavum]
MNNKPFHILLADDDEDDRLIFKQALEELKLKPIVKTVNNGMELMAYLTQKKTPLPHLIFLDLNMPIKNGLECLKEIRSHEKLKNISIAIYSTSSSEKDMEDTFGNGANIYITKSDDFNILKQLLYKAVTATHLYEVNSFDRKNFLLRI